MFINNLKNKFFYCAIIGTMLPGLFWLCKSNKEDKKPVIIIQPEGALGQTDTQTAEIVIKDLILKEVERHKGLEVVVNAGEGKILNSTDKIECKNITCSLNTNKKQIADLKSDNAVIHKTTKNVLLSGATTGHVYEMTINGQDINYNYSNQTLHTNNKINYQHQHFSLSSNQSFVDLKNNKIVMNGGVKSEFLNGSAGNSNSN